MLAPRPWPKPPAHCKECGHRHDARCQHVFGNEGDKMHVCGCEGLETMKQIPFPRASRPQLI